MKRTLLSIALTAICIASAYAGTLITLSEVPAPVNKAIAEYFPGSKAISAKRDTDDGKTKYEVKIQYKEIKLEVEVSPEGKILDVDMEN
jgi:uncharacterized membrane protein YkoI